MIWDDDGIFHAIMADVWRTHHLRTPTPRAIRTPWDKSRKGRPLVLPLPREGIGVGSPTPTTHILTH